MRAREATEERKVVTVLFCDLVGFTAASNAADPEDVRARLNPYHSRLRTELSQFGGTVEKFIGDAVMAVFGAPLAHEDDPERAVRAGLRILDAIADLNESDPGLALEVRIGINTGEAVVSLRARPELGEGIVAGSVVNVASRLQTVAPVGCVVVGEQTYLATENVFEYRKLRPAKIKGKAEVVPLWRALAARSRVGSDTTRVHAAPMVGRELDLAVLKGAFERAVRDRAVEFVTVVGEPGVGKTRLVAELFAHADELREQPMSWRQGRCLPYGEGITFWPLAEIVKAQAGILDSDSPETAGGKLDAILPGEGADRTWLRQRLRPLIGLEGASGVDQEEAFTAWRRFLESIAEQGPAVLVFEDLHWADDAMLAFVEHVVDWSSGVPMLVVATARPELYERRPAWAGGKRNAATINLAPLSDTETLELASLLLHSPELPRSLQALMIEGTGGNPLYTEEYVQLLGDRGLLERDGSDLQLVPGAEVQAPPSIQALIAARLDTLPRERKELLQDASVIGKEFWAGAVAAMGDRDRDGVTRMLHELSRVEFTRDVRTSSMAGEAEYSFWHLLLRDVAYSQIPRAARAEKHRRVAMWIEAKARDRVVDLADVLAYHYGTALELTRAAGKANTAEEVLAARRFFEMAGERALGLDTQRAEANFAKALDLVPPDSLEHARILARWAAAAQQGGRHAVARRSLEEAIAILRKGRDALAAARAMATLGNVLWMIGDARSEQVTAEAVVLLESEPAGPDLVGAYADMAAARLVAGDNEAALAWSERAMALARELGIGPPAAALGFRGTARSKLGDARGLDDLRQALTVALDGGEGRAVAIMYNNLASVIGPIEGPGKVVEVLRDGIAFAERRGIAEEALHMKAGTLEPLIDLGSWDEALESARALAAQFEATGTILPLVVVRVEEARVLAMRGKASEALVLAEWAAKAARESDAIEFIVAAFATHAMARLAAGDIEAATRILSEVEERPHARQTGPYPLCLPGMVRTAVAARDLGLAERLASQIERDYPYDRHAALSALATLTEAKGQTADAARHYAQAAVDWKNLGVVPELAFALLGQGRTLVAADGAEAAAPPLRAARRIFARLRAAPSLAETDSLLEQSDRPGPVTPPTR